MKPLPRTTDCFYKRTQNDFNVMCMEKSTCSFNSFVGLIGYCVFQESEFYFMTDPGEFVSFCHPEKNHWQLLNSPLTRKEFMNLPYITPKFFDFGMMIVSPTTAINRTGKGKVT